MAFAIWSYPGETSFHVAEGDPIELDTLNQVKAPVFVMKPFLPDDLFVVMLSSRKKTVKSAAPWVSQVATQLKKSKGQDLPVYTQLVENATKVLSRHAHLSKVVLSRYEDAPYEEISPTLLDDLRLAYPNAFICLISNYVTGTWLTASPEMFLSCDGDVYKSFSLAGTYIKNEQSLGQKEKVEQQIVTTFIKKVFGEFLSDVAVEETTLQGSGKLMHILNKVKGVRGSELDLSHFISQLHPTPAVNGESKLEALEYLLSHEGYNREMYAGFLGEMKSPNDFELYVNLRCAQLYENCWRFYAGAGITKESIAEKEMVETSAKMDVLKSVILG